MRRKQLLGVALLLLAGCIAMSAATSQLTDVKLSAKGNVGIISLHASGTFTHNEYRPTDNLLLVDLAGVSPARYAGVMKDVEVPGVASYHVLNYSGAAGAEVTRVELALLPGAVVKISDVPGGVAVQITANAIAAPAAPAPAPTSEEAKPKAAAPEATARPASPGRPVTVQDIAVVRGEAGVEVSITGNGALTARAMKLSSPDRVVIDLVNAVPARGREIMVNTPEIKSVRMARYQSKPPVTRVVVDLSGKREYELVPAGNKVSVRFAGSATGATATPATPQQPVLLAQAQPEPLPAPAKAEPRTAPILLAQNTPPVMPPALKPESKMPAIASVPATLPEPSREFVMVEPKYQPKGGPTAEATPVSHFAPKEEVPAFSSFGQSAALSPKVMTTAMQQPAAPAGPQSVSAVPQSCVHDRYTGEPVSVNLKDVDLKDFFRLVHEISGLNIVLDPNVRGTLTLVLDDVPWDQALVIVLQNNGLDCQISGNVLRIATVDTLRKEAESTRAKDEAQALAVPPVTYTHYLSYAHAEEVLPTVKKFLSPRGDVISDKRLNALLIKDIPATIPGVQQLLVQLDRKTQEVEIEARVVAANRSFARDIGTQLGFGWGNGSNTSVGGAGAVGTSPIVVTGLVPRYLTLGNSIPLFSNQPATRATSGLSVTNATNNYRLDFILTAAESRGLVKILSRPRVTTQNNAQALIRQGTQVPVVTAAQLGGPPTVTYVNAFLRLTVTPQITAENTIYLNIDVENTTPDFGNQVGGNPTLLTQQAQTQVLVNDGGTVVLGGVIQTQNSVNIQQVPLLGSIPILGNIFKRRAVSTSTNELIFFITPKIIQT